MYHQTFNWYIGATLSFALLAREQGFFHPLLKYIVTLVSLTALSPITEQGLNMSKTPRNRGLKARNVSTKETL